MIFNRQETTNQPQKEDQLRSQYLTHTSAEAPVYKTSKMENLAELRNAGGSLVPGEVTWVPNRPFGFVTFRGQKVRAFLHEKNLIQSNLVLPAPKTCKTVYATPDSIINTPKGLQCMSARTEEAYAEWQAQLQLVEREVAIEENAEVQKRVGNAEFTQFLTDLKVLPPALKQVVETARSSPRDNLGWKEPVLFSTGDTSLFVTVRTRSSTVFMNEQAAPVVTRQFELSTEMSTGPAKLTLMVQVAGWAGLQLNINDLNKVKLEDGYFAVGIYESNGGLGTLRWPATTQAPELSFGEIVQRYTAETPLGPITSQKNLYHSPIYYPFGQLRFQTPHNSDPDGQFDIADLRRQVDATVFAEIIAILKKTEIWQIPETKPNVTALTLSTQAVNHFTGGSEDWGFYEGSAPVLERRICGVLNLTIPGLPKRSEPSNVSGQFPYNVQTFDTLNPDLISKRVTDVVSNSVNSNAEMCRNIITTIPKTSLDYIQGLYAADLQHVRDIITYTDQLKDTINKSITASLRLEKDLVAIPDTAVIPSNILVGYSILTWGKEGWKANLEQASNSSQSYYPLQYRPEEMVTEPRRQRVTSQVFRVVRKVDIPPITANTIALTEAYVMWQDQALFQAPKIETSLIPKPEEHTIPIVPELTITTIIQKIEAILEAEDSLSPKMAEAIITLKKALEKQTQITFKQKDTRRTTRIASQYWGETSDSKYSRGGDISYCFDFGTPEAKITYGFEASEEFLIPQENTLETLFPAGINNTLEQEALQHLPTQIRLIMSLRYQILYFVQDPLKHHLSDAQAMSIRQVLDLMKTMNETKLAEYYRSLIQPETQDQALLPPVIPSPADLRVQNKKTEVAPGTFAISVYRKYVNLSVAELESVVSDQKLIAANVGAWRLAMAALVGKNLEGRLLAYALKPKDFSWQEVQTTLEKSLKQLRSANVVDLPQIEKEVKAGLVHIQLAELVAVALTHHTLDEYLGENQTDRGKFIKSFDQAMNARVAKNIPLPGATIEHLEEIVLNLIIDTF